jgi:hypothetical protein
LHDQTAYKVAEEFEVYDPPALYDALEAVLDADQPRKEYPLLVGLVEDSVSVTPCVFV